MWRQPLRFENEWYFTTQKFEHGRYLELLRDAVVSLTAQIQSASIRSTVNANYSQQTGLACECNSGGCTGTSMSVALHAAQVTSS